MKRRAFIQKLIRKKKRLMKSDWTIIDEKLFIKGIIAGVIIGGLGLITGIVFLMVIGGLCLFGSIWGKYFR